MANKGDLPHHYFLGKEGERIAIDFIQANGYKLLHKNWRYGKKELDIVAIKNNTIIVFEVKTRFSDYWEEPKDAVRIRKQKNIIEAADAYVNQFNYNLDVQFDIISIIYDGHKYDLEHVPDAFYPTL